MALSPRNRVRTARVAPAATNSQKVAAPVEEGDRFESIVPWYHGRLLEALDRQEASSLDEDDLGRLISTMLRQIEIQTDAPSIGGMHEALATRLVDEMRGLGPLGPLLRDENVTDIMVNGLHSVYVERFGKLEKAKIQFRNADHLTHIAQRIAQTAGRRVDELSPMCDARLEDGSRVNIIGPPLAIDGAAISIRRFREGGFTIDDLTRNNAMSRGMASLLQLAVEARLNIVVSGGTGSGKTTLLNALSGYISPEERVVTLEDAAELRLRQPHVVRLETRPPSAEGVGEIVMAHLLKNALRMRPDRIIVGEVRGDEAAEMLQAMNTGHPGSMCTLHANNPRDALIRLENMLLMGGGEIPLAALRRQIASSIDMVVQLARLRSGHRCVTSVTNVVGIENDVVTTDEMWRRRPGEGEHVFETSGRLPSWIDAADAVDLRGPLLAALQADAKIGEADA